MESPDYFRVPPRGRGSTLIFALQFRFHHALPLTLKHAGAVECAVKNGSIESVPLELMRGRSFDDTIVLIDEAQNLTVAEAKLLLTRVGENTQVIFNGDCTQVDHKEMPGLSKIIHMAKRYMLPVTIVEFGHADIVRSGICKQWVIAFEREER